MTNFGSLVSVIIPCYNLGYFIDETIESVLNQTYKHFEIVIINDGSTDEYTNDKINNYNHPKIKAITTANQGPSRARNRGIMESSGDYILPLDADDIIAPTYLEEAVKILDENEKIGIVYCEATFFGDKNHKWHLPDYSLENMLIDNSIFNTAVFKKSDFLKTKGYNPNMIYGWEDWDFWLSLLELGVEVYKIPKVLFYYRIRKKSREDVFDEFQKTQMFNTLYDNHKKIYHDNMTFIFLHDTGGYFKSNIMIEKGSYFAQLYVDCGSGFFESQSIKKIINDRTMTLSFDLSKYPSIHRIRFDPINDFAHLKMLNVTIVEKNNIRHEKIRFTSSGCLISENEISFNTHDPQVELHLPKIPKIKAVEIKIEYYDVGERFLRNNFRNLKIRLHSEPNKWSVMFSDEFIKGNLKMKFNFLTKVTKALLRNMFKK